MFNFIHSNLFARIYRKITGISYNISYSQTGEDIIIDFLIKARGIRNFTYLDIGANDPVKFSNTFKFYEDGFRGVCIEPDKNLFKRLVSKRPEDICLNAGIGSEHFKEALFYVMDQPVLNSFSRQSAELLEKNGQAKIVEIVKVPLLTVEGIIHEYFNGSAPSFINIDVEGMDEEILLHFPFHKYKPLLFCIETVHYTDDASSSKRSVIFDIMHENGYSAFADTYLNTIFIKTGIS